MVRPQSAVFFFEEDSSIPEHSKPLMLEAVLFCPILQWMSDKLLADGVQRFFVVCGPRFAEAARALYTSHSTVSRAVSALEKELGVPLLVRSNRLLGLTPAGELLLHEGKTLLAAADSLCEKVKEQT